MGAEQVSFPCRGMWATRRRRLGPCGPAHTLQTRPHLAVHSVAVHLGHCVGLGHAVLRGHLVDVDKQVVHAPAAVGWVPHDLAAHAARLAKARVAHAHCRGAEGMAGSKGSEGLAALASSCAMQQGTQHVQQRSCLGWAAAGQQALPLSPLWWVGGQGRRAPDRNHWLPATSW